MENLGSEIYCSLEGGCTANLLIKCSYSLLLLIWNLIYYTHIIILHLRRNKAGVLLSSYNSAKLRSECLAASRY